MDRLILENQVAIMRALRALLADEPNWRGNICQALMACTEATESALLRTREPGVLSGTSEVELAATTHERREAIAEWQARLKAKLGDKWPATAEAQKYRDQWAADQQWPVDVWCEHTESGWKGWPVTDRAKQWFLDGRGSEVVNFGTTDPVADPPFPALCFAYGLLPPHLR